MFSKKKSVKNSQKKAAADLPWPQNVCLKSIKTGVFNLYGYKIGDEGLESIMPFLRTSTSLTVLNLGKNDLGLQVKGSQLIIEALALIPTIIELNIGENHFNGLELQLILNAIKVHPSIRVLNVCNYNLDEKHIQQILDILQERGITHLYLSGCSLNIISIHWITEALKANRTLISLSLNNNNLQSEAASYLAEALHENHTLRNLYVASNNMNHGCVHLIATNMSLTLLDISHNNMDAITRQGISEALQTNGKLTTLILQDNDYSDEVDMAQFELILELHRSLTKIPGIIITSNMHECLLKNTRTLKANECKVIIDALKPHLRLEKEIGVVPNILFGYLGLNSSDLIQPTKDERYNQLIQEKKARAEYAARRYSEPDCSIL